MADEVLIRTGRPEFDGLYPLVRGFLLEDTLDVVIDGQPIHGYRSPDARSIWLRDQSDMMRGAKYFETDLKSAVTHFGETQAANGRIFDYFTTNPEKLPSERENWTKYVRVPVEADVEFRFVKAAWLAWQATGDDEWIRGLLPRMERGLDYIRNHPWRWDEGLGLVKRAYTIDTWDFAYTAGRHEWLQFQIDDHTFWGILHGDNSGYYEAYRIVAALRERFGDDARAGVWRERAEALRDAMNRVCWGGRFYTHFVKLTPVEIPGVDEATQLSLSNPMDINRGVATHEMAASILGEYQRRREESGAFAEWFSIHPPFPDGIFGDEKLVAGAYANGGIMPLVGGELARAAFEHGFEAYGADILRRYHDLVAPTGETYLWYFPDGRHASVETSTSPDAQPTDGWGSSAMLFALVEGLAGVEDRSCLLRSARIAPRWLAADVSEAEVRVGYAASGATLGYSFRAAGDRIDLAVEAARADVEFHVLLPRGTRPSAVRAAGRDLAFTTALIEESPYVDFVLEVRGSVEIRIGVETEGSSGSRCVRCTERVDAPDPARSEEESTPQRVVDDERRSPGGMQRHSNAAAASRRALVSDRISIVTDEISRDLADVRTFLDTQRLDAVELRCVGDGRVPDLSAPDRATLRAWASAADPRILGVSPGIFKCRHDDRRAIERDLAETLPRAVELALELDARFLVAFSFETLGESLDPFAREGLRAAADQCAVAGLPLLVENEPGFGAQTGADLARLVADAGRDNLFVNWDPLNSNELDEPRLSAGLAKVFPSVRHVHVKNGVLAPGERFARCGSLADGDIDWPAHLRRLMALGYDGYFGVETHFEPCREGSAVVLAELREMIADIQAEDDER